MNENIQLTINSVTGMPKGSTVTTYSGNILTVIGNKNLSHAYSESGYNIGTLSDNKFARQDCAGKEENNEYRIP